MNRTVLALGGAVAAFAVTHSFAQQGFGEGGACRKAPPGSGEQLCIDERAWYDQQSKPALSQAPTPTQSPPFDTPPASDVAATDQVINPASEPLEVAEAAPIAEPAAVAEPEPAPTPEASNVSVTTASSMAYANIANGPNGVYIAKVGNYPMSAYALPPRPLPYDKVDAYLAAPRSKQLAENWWAGMDQLAEAETAPASDVSAVVDDETTASHAEIAGDTDVALRSDVGIGPVDGGFTAETAVTPPVEQAAVDIDPPLDDGTSDGADYYY
jgi:hypothetical protein